MLPSIPVVAGDGFNSHPEDPELMGPDALMRFKAGEALPASQMPTPLVTARLACPQEWAVRLSRVRHGWAVASNWCGSGQTYSERGMRCCTWSGESRASPCGYGWPGRARGMASMGAGGFEGEPPAGRAGGASAGGDGGSHLWDHRH